MMSLHVFDDVFNILIVVTVISLTARRFRVPSAVALISAGIVSTFSSQINLPTLGPEIFTLFLLPPIIYHETVHIDIEGLIDDSAYIFSYALFGTLIMLATVSLFAFFILNFTPIEAILLGIIISPTDPVAVIYAFKEMGVVDRFQRIVSGESLFNDGVAIVFYSIITTIVSLGSLTILDIVRISMMAIFGGAILGVLSGYIAHFLFRWTDDKFAKVLISFIVAFGVFRLAEGIGASGVLSVVVAGLIINYRISKIGGLEKESLETLDILWEFIGFAASSIAFIFIGINLELAVLLSNLGPILLLYSFVTLSRYVIIHGLTEILESIRGKKIPQNWSNGLFWSGLRGAVSIVLALGINKTALPNSEKILALTFGVVLVSNLFHGPTIPYVIKHLNISAQDFSPTTTD
jgi:CPA1 family monovalent cation:H+ antiporter